MSFRKNDLVSIVSKETGIVQRDVEAVLNVVLKTIRHKVLEGHQVRLNHFGVFKTRLRPEKIGRKLKGNTKNPEPIILPACEVVCFRPSNLFTIITSHGTAGISVE